MNRWKKFIATALVIAFCGAAVMTARADREDIGRRQVNATPPVSLAFGQTLRVNFLNTGRTPFEIIPCIFDADGERVKIGDKVRLAPVEILSFEINRTEVGRRTDPSVVVRAAVFCDGSVRKHLVVSGEVIDDSTGRTSLFVPGLRVGFDPQPDPPNEN